MRRCIDILMALVVIITASCERRPLGGISNTHYVRVYVNEEIRNVTHGFYNEEYARIPYESPDILRVILSDPETGNVKAERFLRDVGHDEKGTYYEGYIISDPGHYVLTAYNFDTETTVMSGVNNHNEAKATTNEIASHLRTKIPSRASKSPTGEVEKIVYDPDHLFVAHCKDVYIPYVDELDTLKTPEGKHFTAETLVKSYFLQVRVKGMEYASSSVGLLTGMSGSSWVDGRGMDNNDNVTLYFELLEGENPAAGMVKSDDEEYATIYTTFSTFGKIPDAENELEITFDFITTYGKPYSATFDITGLFSTKEAMENQWLLLEHTIEIPEPPKIEGGGFKPSVDDWKDVETDILI